MPKTPPKATGPKQSIAPPLALALAAAVLFWLTIQPKHEHFDYTFRIAGALLHGHVGLASDPGSWLNEFVPANGEYYSVFPLGAVLSLLPVALLKEVGLINSFPGGLVATVIVGLCVYSFYRLADLEPQQSRLRRVLLALFPIFATWSWCNLGQGGAWQIALGFALFGQTGALYFTLVRPRPLLAGACFALAFGNRTELILTCPIYLYWWIFPVSESNRDRPSPRGRPKPAPDRKPLRERWQTPAWFLAIPVVLGLSTAAYNFVRFGSIFDFGYALIPNLITEPWYRHGLFSFSAIPWNVYKMLFEGMRDIPEFPFLQPYPFGCSIFLASPFLFLLFREGGKHKVLAWLAIASLTLILWCHGNPGGWQFSYRYAMILLPWMFILLVSNGPRKLSANEAVLFVVSAAINAMAVYQFLWTESITP
ncbi:MAG TPA: hypothetical protein VH207_02615 [Chthoniobacterales bacterium]|jgi:hypothetical protein|nr:hypothetical protein [Chthoniobacterales bacterium]